MWYPRVPHATRARHKDKMETNRKIVNYKKPNLYYFVDNVLCCIYTLRLLCVYTKRM